MKVVVISNLRWHVLGPSRYRLACPATHHVDLIYVGRDADGQWSGWFLTDGTTHVPVPDRDTGAMLLAKQLNKGSAAV